MFLNQLNNHQTINTHPIKIRLPSHIQIHQYLHKHTHTHINKYRNTNTTTHTHTYAIAEVTWFIHTLEVICASSRLQEVHARLRVAGHGLSVARRALQTASRCGLALRLAGSCARYADCRLQAGCWHGCPQLPLYESFQNNSNHYL